MFNYWLYCMKNAFTFSGRARRSEFWFFRLTTLILFISYFFLFGLFFYGAFSAASNNELSSVSQGLSILSIILSVAFFVFGIWTTFAAIAVTIRRMHDTNRSGWYMLIPFYSFILLITEGNREENYYGPDPKGTNIDNEISNNDILDA